MITEFGRYFIYSMHTVQLLYILQAVNIHDFFYEEYVHARTLGAGCGPFYMTLRSPLKTINIE